MTCGNTLGVWWFYSLWWEFTSLTISKLVWLQGMVLNPRMDSNNLQATGSKIYSTERPVKVNCKIVFISRLSATENKWWRENISSQKSVRGLLKYKELLKFGKWNWKASLAAQQVTPPCSVTTPRVWCTVYQLQFFKKPFQQEEDSSHSLSFV